MSCGGAPHPFRMPVTMVGVAFGGMFALSAASSITIHTFQSVLESKRRKVAVPCKICKGKGFYICKLCKGNATIEWSPLHGPVVINPCLCPTCDGNRVQRCLNCIGKGYS